jgi:hypothetical protein
MLKRFQITDHTRLPDIQAWIADPDHRTVLIQSQSGPVVEYHVIVDLNHGNLDLLDLLLTEFPTAVVAAEFPRSHPL